MWNIYLWNLACLRISYILYTTKYFARSNQKNVIYFKLVIDYFLIYMLSSLKFVIM